jgi:hypothetical protein
MAKRKLEAGDVVRNLTTKEEGRIARVLHQIDHPSTAEDVAYVVSLPPNIMMVGSSISLTIDPGREVLWRNSEIIPIE